MATLTPLNPDATGTVTSVTDEAGGTTNLHTKVNDAVDTTYLTPGLDSDGTVTLGLSNVDTDLASMDTVSVMLRTAHIGTRTDDTVVCYAQIFDAASGGNALTNEVTVDQYTAGGATAYSDKTVAFTITGTPTKTQWNNAHIQIRWDHTKSKGSDGISIRVSKAQITGTYTQASSNRTGSIAQSVGAVTQSATGTHDDPDFTGTISQTVSAVTQSATGTAVEPTSAGVIDQTLAPVTQAATGTHVEPVDQGVIDQTLAPVAQVATGTFSAPAIATPTNLVATAVGGSQIDLTWDAVGGADGYDIERDAAIIVYNHPTNSFSDTGLDASTEYTYRVRAVA